MKDKIASRRNLLKTGLAAASALSVAKLAKAQAFCQTTVAQPEGPFYPINDQADKDNDLTFIRGSKKGAKGEVVRLKGIVQDENCRPIEGTLVEIWQACESGKYNHPGDPNPAELDPNFQYWGKAITNKKGEYSFLTIKPGSYQATNDWKRPPHIHLKAQRRGYQEIITQVYFSEEKELNRKDRILSQLSQAEQDSLVLNFHSDHQFVPTGKFNINLKEL